jgi:hypothetical protein
MCNHNSDNIIMRRTIGGEFELSTLAIGSTKQLEKLTHGYAGTWTASGRSALSLILEYLQNTGIKHVHLPAYLCESILLAVKALGLQYSFYPVDSELAAHPDPPPNSAVLLIHYFGWLNPATTKLRAEAGRSFYLIEDASQALLSDWATTPDVSRFIILSPRKFGPVPLGGWCNISMEVDRPTIQTEKFMWQSLAARFTRATYMRESDERIEPSIEKFYIDAFNEAEEFLDNHPCEASVPQIALELIAGLDWDSIARRRRANWLKFDELLSGIVDPLNNVLPDDVVPLGYVIRLKNRNEVRRKLRDYRIFCPVHWPLPAEVNPLNFPDAVLLSKSILTIPIDQRYDQTDMVRIAHAIKMLL